MGNPALKLPVPGHAGDSLDHQIGVIRKLLGIPAELADNLLGVDASLQHGVDQDESGLQAVYQGRLDHGVNCSWMRSIAMATC